MQDTKKLRGEPRAMTLAEYNNSRLLAADIKTGKQYRRLRRAGKV